MLLEPFKKIPSLRAMLIVLAFFMAAPSFLLLQWLKDRVEDQAFEIIVANSTAKAGKLAADVHMEISRVREHLENLRERLAFAEGAEKILLHLRALQAEFPMYANLLLVDGEGQVLASSIPIDPPSTFNISSGKSGLGFSVLPLQHMTFGGETRPVLPHTLGVMSDGSGKPLRVLVALVDVEHYTKLVRSPGFASKWDSALVDADRQFLLSDAPLAQDLFSKALLLVEHVPNNTEDPDYGWVNVEDSEGGARVFGYVKLRVAPDNSFYMLVLAAYADRDILQEFAKISSRGILVMLVISGFGLILASYLGTRYLLDPLSKFLDATRRFARGDLKARSGIDYRLGEIGMLANAFDETADVVEIQNNLQRETKAELALYASHLEELVRERTHALAESEHNTRLILASSPIIFMITSAGAVLSINGNGTQLLGLQTGDSVEAMHVDAELQTLLLKESALGKPFDNCPVRLFDKDGNICETLISLRPFVFEGRPSTLTWIADVTELMRARREAEEGARAKSDFLARMSHEVRTPMNAILGMTHLCLQSDPTLRQKNYLEKIQSSTENLLALVSDILDFSKIEAGKLALEKSSFRLSEMLLNLRDLIAFKAEKKGLSFIVEVEENVPDSLIGDSLHLNQILLNLCDNAITFTESGEVTVHVSLDLSDEKRERGQVLLNFTVSDTGIGMTPKQTELVFNPFFQIDSSITRRNGGTGLGLTICGHLVHSMGGEIFIDSALNRGTVVRFLVPMETGIYQEPVTAVPSRSTASPNSGMKGKVLLVEDNLLNQELVLGLLDKTGVRVDVAQNGAEAVRCVQKQSYDLIFMDIQMPVMDGLEATRRIRALPDEIYKDLPIVALTAHALQNDRVKSLDAGMNDHITKPIDPSELYAALEKWLKGKSHTVAPTDSDESALGKDLNEVPGLSVRRGLFHHGGNAMLYKSLLRKFAGRYGGDEKDIRKQLEGGDADSAKRALHTLKGLAAGLGMEKLSESARTLETAIKKSEPYVEELENFEKLLHETSEALLRVFEEGALENRAIEKECGADNERTETEINALIQRIADLPSMITTDLIKAWEEVGQVESMLLKSSCAADSAAFAAAIRDCDATLAEERGKTLQTCLNAMLEKK